MVITALALPPAGAGVISQVPLHLTLPVEPLVMLNMSNDHQIYHNAYDDYSDLNPEAGDGPDTTYKHSIDYYGYFDSYKCYSYNSGRGRFEPASITTTKYCSGNWSGNFLNWATMTRIDTVRKILYGGHRVVDTATDTVLERSYLPNDAHSFAKFYDGPNQNRLTPFSHSQGFTICNTTVSAAARSQSVTDPPLLRMARGNFSLWAANERWQCRWEEEKITSNLNVSIQSGIDAAPTNPIRIIRGMGLSDYVVRVQVCVAGLIGQENCKRYPSGNYKPIGLLQTYGDDNQVFFGLMTGSYGKNKSGGVLRKNIGSFQDEVNVATDGTFRAPPGAGNIVGTLNRLRIYGYRHDNGSYFGAAASDNCPWRMVSFANGDCSNWGNPQSEILLESLRYLAGRSPNFATDDSSYLPGLITATWSDPIPAGKWCAPLNVIQFNASTSSYDGDELGGSGDIGAGSAASLTDTVGAGEGIHGNQYFVGETAALHDQLCTAKTVASLGAIRGTCPDEPRLGGSYLIAGLAHYAHTNDIRSGLQGDQQVNTYGVALAPTVPRITVPVPGRSHTVTLLPACRNTWLGTGTLGNCALVDFKIIEQDIAAGTGRFYVSWEDSEQGGDYDQDMWGVLSYRVDSAANRITVETDVVASSAVSQLGFGYIISGTTQDGFHVHSGDFGFMFGAGSPPIDATGVRGCANCDVSNLATSHTFTLLTGAPAVDLLEPPLYYAAKWGGFVEGPGGNGIPDRQQEWDVDADGIPDSYFYAIDPAQLAQALDEVFLDVIETGSASAAAVVANSARLQSDTHLYQARFDSGDWSGQLLAFRVQADGNIDQNNPVWDAADEVPAAASRNIWTINPTTFDGVPFTAAGFSSDFTPAQVAALNTDAAGNPDPAGGERGIDRLNYLRGDQSAEQSQGGPFRDRDRLLGDIVNSDPIFVGAADFGYDVLPGAEGSSYPGFVAGNRSRTPMVYAGANDGMLHGFNAATGEEELAYVPNAVFPNLSKLTDPNYGHQYYVDGSPWVGDAYIGGWRTVLVGSTGAGGRAVFALDVTNPAGFNSGSVLWEFTHRDLGFTLPRPSMVRMKNGQWVAIFGNGYNSDNHKAVLFVVDLATGNLLRAIETREVGNAISPNGLGAPIVIDTDRDRIADAAYAGDLYGNLWKFDLTGSGPADWVVAFNGNPLITAVGPDGARQPITARPDVVSHPLGGLLVVFGTGQFFEVGDNVVVTDPSDPDYVDVQSFYGVRDNGNTPVTINAATRSSVLQEQRILQELDQQSFRLRVTDNNPLDPATKGWFLDLVSPAAGRQGERVVSAPLLRHGRVIFATLIPSQEPCDFGGTSWLMVLNAGSGSRPDEPVIELDGDREFDHADLVGSNAPAGIQSEIGIVDTPSVISAGEVDDFHMNGPQGHERRTMAGDPDRGRQAWRELQ